MVSNMKRRTDASWLIRFSSVTSSVIVLSILFTVSLIFLMNHLPTSSPTRSYWSRGRYSMEYNLSTVCPLVSPLSVGWMDLSFVIPELMKDPESDTFYNQMNRAGLEKGGAYRPKDCQSRSKVAIVVPYRNRSEHLAVFMRYMHPFLQRQQLDYTIFVVEQTGTDELPFNRGMLFNIGFVEAQRLGTFQCFIFHDVDILPEDDRNVYSCPEDGKPRHMSFVIDIHDYKPMSLMLLFGGGVIAVSRVDFVRANGYSNDFWGLGLEDDDFYRRIRRLNMSVTRPDIPVEQLRYRTLYHDPSSVDVNPNRQKIFDDGYLRFETDGLVNLKYRLDDLRLKPLYTHVFAKLKA